MALRNQMKGGPCKAYIEGVKLEVAEDETYYYPDVFVTCSPADHKEPYLMRNPTLVAEVHLETTRRTDEGEKLDSYLRMPSLRHILLVDIETQSIFHYFRADEGLWDVRILSNEKAVLEQDALNVKLPVKDVFAVQ